ncbi:MAG: MmgE/PrpD family protein [Chloroflexi bacterium]|nr:MmgE/PrpD family protein [Chloroflexota bacterium]
MTYAQRLAEFATALRFADLPAEAQRKVKHLLATTVGLGFASAHYPLADAFARLAADYHGVESPLLGRAARAPAPLAAAFHSTVAHGLEFDDTHPAGPLHAGSIVVPAIFAAACAAGASGEALLAGVAAGLELHCRLGLAAAGQFWKRGFYSTAVMGGPAAALAVSRALGLPAATAADAFGIASTFSGLTHEPLVGAHHATKHAAVGWAAQGAVVAVRLALAGFDAHATSVEGKDGLYESFVGAGLYDLARIDADLGATWHLLDIIPKQYPLCHHGHAFVEAALALRARGVAPEAIRRITAVTTEPTARFMWRPAESQRPPATPQEGKFNLRYLVGAALVRGRVDLDAFRPAAMADGAVWRLASRMDFTLDPTLSFRQFPGDLTVELADGRVVRCQIPATRGTRANPETPDEMRGKFEQCVQPVLGAVRAAELWGALTALETVPDVRDLLPLMQV